MASQPAALLKRESVSSTDIQPSLRGKHFDVNLADGFAPADESFTERLRRLESAAHRDPVERRGINRQHRFAFEAPTAQNAFKTAKLAVVVEQLVGFGGGQDLVAANALQSDEGARFAP